MKAEFYSVTGMKARRIGGTGNSSIGQQQSPMRHIGSQPGQCALTEAQKQDSASCRGNR